MKIKLSGRIQESATSSQELIDLVEEFGEAKERRESILAVDDREALL